MALNLSKYLPQMDSVCIDDNIFSCKNSKVVGTLIPRIDLKPCLSVIQVRPYIEDMARCLNKPRLQSS